MLNRDKLLKLIPDKWFSDSAKAPGGVLYAVLSALGAGLDYLEDGLAYVKAQTRIGTAYGSNLDLIAGDFFGNLLPRISGESDGAYRNRILANLLKEQATRRGVTLAVEALGCQVVEIFESNYDGFFTDFSCCDATRISDNNPYEAIMFITRPLSPLSAGLLFTDYNYTDYNYVPNENSPIWSVSDQDIYDAIEESKTAGTRIWAVLDPIPVTQTTGPNYVSAARYAKTQITKPAPRIGVVDETSTDDGSVAA